MGYRRRRPLLPLPIRCSLCQLWRVTVRVVIRSARSQELVDEETLRVAKGLQSRTSKRITLKRGRARQVLLYIDLDELAS